MRRVNCGHAGGPPLVTQPIIAENTQYTLFRVNADQHAGTDTAMLPSAVIEQQAPLYNARFFEWLAPRLAPLMKQQLSTKSSWGLDKMRCGAAFHYANAVLDQPRRVPCAIITVPVSHQNTRTIRKNGHYQKAGFAINDWIMSPNASAADANWRDFVEGQKALSRILIVQNCLGNGGNLVWPPDEAERAICCPSRCGGCDNTCTKADETCCIDHILRVHRESRCPTNSAGADATPCTYDVDPWGYAGVYQFGAFAPPTRARVKRNTKRRARTRCACDGRAPLVRTPTLTFGGFAALWCGCARAGPRDAQGPRPSFRRSAT